MFLIVIITLNSCNTAEKPEKTIEEAPPERGELSMDSKIFFGNRLFSEKTCITCHAINRTKAAPSVVDIMIVYKKNDASIEAFLKGNSEPIVETNDSLVAVMQANIDGFLKKVTDEDLNAISTYMMHITE